MDIATRLRAKLKLDSDESLVDMFDDILLAFNSRLQDSAYLEEQMLQMAIHFEKTRKRYVALWLDENVRERFWLVERENFHLIIDILVMWVCMLNSSRQRKKISI